MPVFLYRGHMTPFQYRDNFPFEALQAIKDVLDVGAVKGYLPGVWRETPMEEHLKKARGHLLKLAQNKDDGEDHLKHALARLAMAAAVRRAA